MSLTISPTTTNIPSTTLTDLTGPNLDGGVDGCNGSNGTSGPSLDLSGSNFDRMKMHGGHGGGHGGMKKAEDDAAADALDMDPDDLEALLASGQSLSAITADVANKQGVNPAALQGTVTQAMATALTTQNPNMDPAVAGKLAAHRMGGSHQQQTLAALAPELNMSASDLQAEFKGGESLSAIAAAQGVDETTLETDLQAALQTVNPNASPDRLDNMFNRLLSANNSGSALSTASAAQVPLAINA